MLLLNYSHPLTAAQLDQVDALVGAEPEVRAVAVQIDQSLPLGLQVVALADAAGLSPEEWQTRALLVNLPGLAAAAGALLAELHGRVGHFPATLRLRPVAGSVTPMFEVAEILNLQAMREAARRRRAPGSSA